MISITAFQGGVGYLLAGQSAVGNSRLVNRDVSNVSCRQVPDPYPGMGQVARMAASYIRRLVSAGVGVEFFGVAGGHAFVDGPALVDNGLRDFE